MSTILVIDDVGIFREPLAASRRLAGYETACAANGREALDAIRAKRPDLIPLDLAMPVMDGLSFLKALRAGDGVTLRAEILALTGMLSGMTRGDGERLMEPLRPRGELRVWLAREQTLSAFDPLAAALDAMAHVDVRPGLPKAAEWADCDALVVATRSPAMAGFTSAEIERCVAARADGRPTPVLWLSGTEPRGLPADALPVRKWPISLDELHQFVAAAEAASPAVRAAHESRIRVA